jgi:hypothetical protein
MSSSDRDWADKALSRVQARRTTTHRHRPATMHLEFDHGFLTLLREAAHSRGIGVTAYCRRAISAFIARDLGIDWTIPLSFCAKATPPEQTGRGKRTTDDGQGYGDWSI